MYVLMKILESSPERYDRWISLVTLGRLDSVYARMASYIERGMKVLEIGCGTGLLTVKLLKRGAHVKAVDSNPSMLKIARERFMALGGNFAKSVELCEMGVTGLDKEKVNSYDAVVSGLCFSELSDDEISFALREIGRILKSNGLLLIADESVPPFVPARMVYWFVKVPFLIITYFVTGTVTRGLKNFNQVLAEKNFRVREVRYSRLGSFIEIVAKKLSTDS